MAQNQLFSKVGLPTTAQPDSPLLMLPPEIRNDIYERVLTHLVVGPCGGGSHLMDHNNSRNYGNHPKFFGYTAKNLLLACKQIHAEAIKVFYHTATFYFVLEREKSLNDWIKNIGPARASLIRDIRLDIILEECELWWEDPMDEMEDAPAREYAKAAQDCLDQNREEAGLPEGVLRIQICFEGYVLWTEAPSELAEAALKNSTYISQQFGRVWITEPSETLKSSLRLFHSL